MILNTCVYTITINEFDYFVNMFCVGYFLYCYVLFLSWLGF